MKYFIFSLACLLFSNHVWAQAPTKMTFEQHVFYHNGQKLNFQLLAPPNMEKGKDYPLVLFLHGAGSRGDDNKSPATHIHPLFTKKNMQDFPCYVLIPQCPEEFRWVETDWGLPAHTQPDSPSVPLYLVIQLLEHSKKTYAVDSHRIYLTGLSMGGFGVWDLLSRLPDQFAAAAPICGGGDPATSSNFSHIPIWCFHGDQDRAVMVQRSRDMVNALKKLDAPIRYTEYQGIGHGSWKPAYAEPEFLKWLFSHQKEK